MIIRALPETHARFAGYSYLMSHYELKAPVPMVLSAIGRLIRTEGIYTHRI